MGGTVGRVRLSIPPRGGSNATTTHHDGVLAVTTGLRQSELLGLQWRDVDLDKRELKVHQQLQQYDRQFHLGPPKSRAGKRELGIGQIAVDALTRQRAQQNKDRLRAGDWDASLHQKPTDFVFTTPTGGPLDRFHVSRQFKALLERAKLPPVKFYDLRHTAAASWLLGGTKLHEVSELLGHSTSQFTFDTYGHVLKRAKHEAARVMDQVVDGKF